MTDPARRRRMVADIVRTGTASSQEEVTARLAGLGMTVTQATVSRDLEQLGAVKVRRGGAMAYALPGDVDKTDFSAARLSRILAEWVYSVEAAGSLVVVKTPPGSAHLVGAAIDGARLPQIAGTVSGDDTIFVAPRDGVTPSAVADRLRTLSTEPA